MKDEEIYVGMRVVVSGDSFAGLESLRSKGGTVVGIKPGHLSSALIGVEFDDRFSLGHNCDGLCESGRGRWGRAMIAFGSSVLGIRNPKNFSPSENYTKFEVAT